MQTCRPWCPGGARGLWQRFLQGWSTRTQVSVCRACRRRATSRAGRTEHRGANSGASRGAERRWDASERSATFLRRLLHLFCLLDQAYLLGQGLDAPEKAHAARRPRLRLAAARVASPRARAACFTAFRPRLACSAPLPGPAAPCASVGHAFKPKASIEQAVTVLAVASSGSIEVACHEPTQKPRSGHWPGETWKPASPTVVVSPACRRVAPGGAWWKQREGSRHARRLRRARPRW